MEEYDTKTTPKLLRERGDSDLHVPSDVPLQLCLSNFKVASKPLSANLDSSGTGCAESHRILIGQEMLYC